MSSIDETKQDEQTIQETPKVETQIETSDIPEETEEDGLDIDPMYDDDVDESEDSLTFSNGVIEKIVAVAMRDVPGVIGMKGGWLNRVQDVIGASDPRKGVTVEVTPDAAVRVNISVLIEYGAYAPQVFEDVKHAVVDAVTGMTGLEIAGVNLRIEDVLTPEEIEARQPKLPATEEPENLPEAEVEEAEVEEAEVETEGDVTVEVAG
jgi:uncharacterized alkaline shock family protein YloU